VPPALGGGGAPAGRPLTGGVEIMHDVVARLRGVPGAAALLRRPDGLWMEAPGLDVLSMAVVMAREDARLITMTGVPGCGIETTVVYHYAVGTTVVHVKTETRQRGLPSIAAVLPAAGWIEREIADLFAVRFDGHPAPGRLLRPPALSPGFFHDAETVQPTAGQAGGEAE
jgi:hypothetical protein